MDYRLDLYNAVDKFEEQMTEDDALFIICHNVKDGDCLMGLSGNFDFIAGVLSHNDYVKIQNKTQGEKYESAKRMVINMAINILATDEDLKSKFLFALKTVPADGLPRNT